MECANILGQQLKLIVYVPELNALHLNDFGFTCRHGNGNIQLLHKQWRD